MQGDQKGKNQKHATHRGGEPAGRAALPYPFLPPVHKCEGESWDARGQLLLLEAERLRAIQGAWHMQVARLSYN